MGKFIFETAIKVELEDRLLAHVEHVITSKLRRNESFTFTWKEDVSVGGGRVTVWLHRGSNIVYKFHGGRSPSLNAAWLHALSYTASGPHGLYIVPEPDGAAARRGPSSSDTMKFRIVPSDEPAPVS